MTLRVAVLASGNGSNLEALIERSQKPASRFRIEIVLCNIENAFALTRAHRANIPAMCIPHQKFASRKQFEESLLAALKPHNIQLVVLAGFMRILSPLFINAYPNAIINVHPSLLPAFPGAHAVRNALVSDAKKTGCTVHFVDKGVDTGPIIAQQEIPIFDDDIEETLQQRIAQAEHVLLPNVVERLANQAHGETKSPTF